MNWITKSVLILITLALLSSSCDRDAKPQPRTYTQEELLDANRKIIHNESDYIDEFIARNDWKMEKTATGLRYEIYHDSSGASPTTEMIATVSYRAYLLDSTEVGNTAINGPQQFRIGRDAVISGLHEAVTLLSPGDSARFILPAYLAYGLTGDKNIPSNAALFYDLSLISIQ